MKTMLRSFALGAAALVLGSASLLADSPRMVLIEEGTNASCGPCARQNPTFHSFLETADVKSIAIPLKYQAWFPGRDIMNAADSNLHNSRVRYYGFQNIGVPCVAAQGAIQDASNSQQFYSGAPADTFALRAAIEAVRGTMSPITLGITETREGNKMNISIKLNTSASISGNKVLRVVVAERYRYYANAGTNGEREFWDISRKMLPSLAGEPLAITAGGEKTFNYTYTIPTSGNGALDPTMVYVVAFVQDEDTKEVLQAGTNAKQDVQVGVSVEQPFLLTIPRSQSITKEVKVVNPSSVAADVNLSIDKDSYPLPSGWNATISPATVKVPANGEATVEVTVTSTADAAYTAVGIKAVPVFENAFNLPFTNAFGVLSESPKIITFSGFSNFAASNYSSTLAASVKKDAVVLPYNTGLIQQYADQISEAQVQIFPIGGNPLSLPQEYQYANPLTQIETAMAAKQKVMIVAPQAMQWAYASVNNISDGNMPEVQDFYTKMGLLYSSTAQRYNGNTLNAFTVRGVTGDPIGNRLNNGAIIQCNQAASIQNASYSLFTDVFIAENKTIATPFLYFDNDVNKVAAARIEMDGNRMIYASFGYESIGTAAVANELFKRSVDWLLTGSAASVGETLAEGTNETLSLSISPNPASDIAMLNYSIRGNSGQYIRISVVDAMGREMAQVFSGEQQPGSYQASFNAAQLPAGAYRMILRSMGGNGVQLPLMITR